MKFAGYLSGNLGTCAYKNELSTSRMSRITDRQTDRHADCCSHTHYHTAFMGGSRQSVNAGSTSSQANMAMLRSVKYHDGPTKIHITECNF